MSERDVAAAMIAVAINARDDSLLVEGFAIRIAGKEIDVCFSEEELDQLRALSPDEQLARIHERIDWTLRCEAAG